MFGHMAPMFFCGVVVTCLARPGTMFFLWGGLLIILDICNLYDVYEQLLNDVFIVSDK